MKPWPLVSVGLPTYNRATTLPRAIESVLAQDYEPLELIISDNGSTDETQALCEEYCRRDQRVRYIRQPTNRGPKANFLAPRNLARGEYFMWLGDDDWLDSGYVEECARLLMELPDYELVCGRGKYFQEHQERFLEEPINLSQDSRKQRVLAFYRQVGMNGTMYGIMRREVLLGLEIPDTLGGDWLLMANIAYLGKVRTLEGVFVNRSIAGSSQNMERHALNQGFSKIVARNVHLFISWKVFEDIAWRSPIYKSLGKLRRMSLGWRAGMIIARRYGFPKWINSLLDGWDRLRARLIIRTRLKQGWARIAKRSF